MEGKKVVDFCIQVVKTLVSQGFVRRDLYSVAQFQRAGSESLLSAVIC